MPGGAHRVLFPAGGPARAASLHPRRYPVSSHKSLVRFPILMSVVLALAMALLLAGSGAAQSPAFPYQGELSDPAGAPVPDGAYALRFALYDAPEGGKLLWSETQAGVPVQGGAFETALGAAKGLPADIAALKLAWLAVSVRGPGESTFTLLEPRQSIAPDSMASTAALACPHSHFGDSWTGTSSAYALIVEQDGTGDGIRAYSNATAGDYGAVYAANTAGTGVGRGVYGSSNYGTGVYAKSTYNDGLEATTAAPMANGKSAIWAHAENANGVWGISTNRIGAVGISTNDFGMVASGNDASLTDTLGDLRLDGNYGEIFAPGSTLALSSNRNVYIELDKDLNDDNAVFVVTNLVDGDLFRVYENGNTWAPGTKSAVVQTEDFGSRLLYSVESPEVWFEDAGSAQLVAGKATVSFDPIFAQTANTGVAYNVSVTPVCAQPTVLFVSAKTAAGFTVEGVDLKGVPSDCGFDWRVMVKRAGFEAERLEAAPTDLSGKQ